MAGNSKSGRLSQYDEYVKPYLDDIERWISEGYTEVSIAKALGIGETSFVKYKKQNKELATVIRRGRANVEQLVRGALIKMALGYYDDNGRYHAPDYKAAIMIMRNYRTSDWTEWDKEELAMRKRELKIKEDLAKEKIIEGCDIDE